MSRQQDPRSKTHYHGAVLKRTHRSEYDDSKLRDLARQEAKLDQDLKTVERARNVMKKSMEADRQLFMKAGSQNTTKITKGGLGTRASIPTSTNTVSHSRLVSDTRVKKSSTSDLEPPDFSGLKVTGASKTDRQARDDKSVHSQSKETKSSNSNGGIPSDAIKSSSSEASSKSYKTVKDSTSSPIDNVDSIYDNFLLLEPKIILEVPTDKDVSNGGKPSTKTQPTLKVTSETKKNTGTKSPGGYHLTIPDGITEPGATSPRLAVGTEKRSPRYQNNGSRDPSPRPYSIDDQSRPKNKWDVLSTPKHQNANLSKRAQIEQEFSPKVSINGSSKSNLSVSPTGGKKSPSMTFTGTGQAATSGKRRSPNK